MKRLTLILMLAISLGSCGAECYAQRPLPTNPFLEAAIRPRAAKPLPPPDAGNAFLRAANSYKAAKATYIACALADSVSTEIALARNGNARELNPLLGGNAWRRIGLGAGVKAGSYFLFTKVVRPRNPKAAKWLLRIAGAPFCGYAVNNFAQARKR